MGQAAQKVAGSTFQIDIASTFTNIGEIISQEKSGPTGDDIETTTMLENPVYKTFLPGLVDDGEVTLSLNLEEDMATQSPLTDNIAAGGTSTLFRIVQANADVYEFSGYCKEFSISGETNSKWEATAIIKADGLTPTVYPAATPGP